MDDDAECRTQSGVQHRSLDGPPGVHLKDQDVSIISAVLVTTRLIGDHPRRLVAAREIVECSPSRTPSAGKEI
ncbi:hypothetical protein ACWGLE_04300 [Streptomyces sp. NPDC055897]